jgi:hypothetical protein
VTTAPAGRVLTRDVVYYATSPAQARPPDGTLKRGTPVDILQDAGSYAKIRAPGGITGYVERDAISSEEPTR